MNIEAGKKCVLVVDDQPKVLRFVEINLKIHGFDVLTATSGEEALKLVVKEKPDIMLLDVIMPGMDGFEVLEKLRLFSDIPVIAFSASEANSREALLLGSSDFISKPFQPDDMLRHIEVLLNCNNHR